MTVDVSTLQSLGLTASTSSTSSKQQLGQDEFLKLMTAQLNNQNPLKPLDNTEFLSQMAQFSTVTSLQDLQSSFKDLASSYQQEQTLSAASLVGHSALVKSDKGMLGASSNLQGALVLPSDASSVKLKITDSSGQVVKTLDLGAQTAGTVSFSWDGAVDGNSTRAAAGTYHVTAEAVVGGENTALETEIAAVVTGVTMGGSKGMEVELEGLGRYKLSDIQGVV